MKRQSTEQRGYVRFPIDDPAYTNTMQGGTTVVLVVEDSPYSAYDETWRVACGPGVYTLLDECYLTDHDGPRPAVDDADDQAYVAHEAYHFPHLRDPETHALVHDDTVR